MKAIETSPEVPQLLTVADLARMVRCCPRTIRKMAKVPGVLPPSVQIGRRRLWEQSNVAAWLSSTGGAAKTASGVAK